MDVHLLGSGDVQVPQVALQLLVGSLQVEQGLCKRRACMREACMEQRLPRETQLTAGVVLYLGHRLLELIGLSPTLLHNLLAARRERHCDCPTHK